MNPRRTLLKTFAALGLYGPAGISGLIREVLAAGNAPIKPGLRKLRGEVKIDGVTAQQDQIIRPGNTVVTGQGAEAIYVIGQDAFLQRENSVVTFGTAATAHLMRVITGKILSVFGKGPRTIRVTTATIGIRGTGCYIEDEGTGSGARTYFCLCYGSVELTPDIAPQEPAAYSTTHHEHPLYIYNDANMPHAMVPAGVLNHTDAELTLLENLVGRWPPFYGKGGRTY